MFVNCTLKACILLVLRIVMKLKQYSSLLHDLVVTFHNIVLFTHFTCREHQLGFRFIINIIFPYSFIL